jgi:hypothetical protein
MYPHWVFNCQQVSVAKWKWGMKLERRVRSKSGTFTNFPNHQLPPPTTTTKYPNWPREESIDYFIIYIIYIIYIVHIAQSITVDMIPANLTSHALLVLSGMMKNYRGAEYGVWKNQKITHHCHDKCGTTVNVSYETPILLHHHSSTQHQNISVPFIT